MARDRRTAPARPASRPAARRSAKQRSAALRSAEQLPADLSRHVQPPLASPKAAVARRSSAKVGRRLGWRPCRRSQLGSEPVIVPSPTRALLDSGPRAVRDVASLVVLELAFDRSSLGFPSRHAPNDIIKHRVDVSSLAGRIAIRAGDLFDANPSAMVL